jgi:hypothetical protein
VSFDARPVRHAYEVIVNEYAGTFSGELATNAFDRSVIDETLSRLRAGASSCGVVHGARCWANGSGYEFNPIFLTGRIH